jgi:CheY-like chemotaxis protein
MNKTLMIVDDAKDQISLMQILMKSVAPEISVMTAYPGDEALGKLCEDPSHRPRVVLMDLKLLGKTGIETLREMKSNPDLKRIPVCMFSNGDFREDACEAYDTGASFYFKKPIRLAALKNFLTQFVGIWFQYASVCG